MKKFLITILSVALWVTTRAQHAPAISGTVFDALTKEALPGALITDHSGHQAIAHTDGRFNIVSPDTILMVSLTGYSEEKIRIISASGKISVAMMPAAKDLQQVVISANRTAEKRSEAPLAISIVTKQMMEDTKANQLDQLLNKVSGVFMVSLGNEQHEMSIRQPMTTKSVFLYMEDGIPIRTTGVYNHNALLEMNMTAAKSIEVIKGPASALYGAEAIAGAVNVITQGPPAVGGGAVSVQVNGNGYKRADLQAGSTFGKWGIIASGYFARRNDGPVDYSDFHKTAFTLRADYKPSDKTSWSTTLGYVDYYSDMTGTLDSLKFAQHNYSTPYTFTYRSVNALRVKSMLNHQWNEKSSSSLAILFRDNSVGQNPSYSIGSTSDPLIYKGQINVNAFNTYAAFLQHTQRFRWLNSKLVAGASIDLSPQTYRASFIRINKDPATGKYVNYTSTDSLLNDYRTGISNIASYADFEMNIARSLKLVTALRYDAFGYDFVNHLPPSANAPSGITHFGRFTPKAGLTWNSKGTGIYLNYSQGYVPPQITELYNSTQAPYLLPQTFYNYEAGGWLSLFKNKFYADWSIYLMNGTNEIISVRLPDNTYVNQNAGKTRHLGIEYGVTYKPSAAWGLRISATNARHTFTDNIVKGVDYNGKEMSAAPRFTGNMEATYKPAWVKGLRMSLEWQHQGAYFMDDLDKHRYSGFDLINLRAGYIFKKTVEVWVNALNALNRYYSPLATKNATISGNASYAYQLGDPREITVGVSYKFGKK